MPKTGLPESDTKPQSGFSSVLNSRSWTQAAEIKYGRGVHTHTQHTHLFGLFFDFFDFFDWATGTLDKAHESHELKNPVSLESLEKEAQRSQP